MYICSHGIQKSIKNLDNNKYYYVKSDKLNNFSIPNKPFVLVTGDADTTIPHDFQDKSNNQLKN